MFCIKCGNNIPEGNRFCPVCGEPAEIELNPEDRTLTSYDGNQGHSEGIEEGGFVKQGFNNADRRDQGMYGGQSYGDGRDYGGQGMYGGQSYGDGRDYGGREMYGSRPYGDGRENSGSRPYSGGRDRRQSGNKGKGKSIIIIVLLVIIAILLGLVAFSLLHSKDGTDDKDTADQRTETKQEEDDTDTGGGNQDTVGNDTGGGNQDTGGTDTGGGNQDTVGSDTGGGNQDTGATDTGGGNQNTGGSDIGGGNDPGGENTEADTYDSIRNSVYNSGSSDGTSLELVTTDVSGYPNVKAYYRLEDSYGETIILDSPTAGITEAVSGGTQIERKIRSIERLEGNQGLGMDIVVDKSDSMESDFAQVQSILNDFIRSMDYASGDAAEIIAFDSYIMYMCSYTNEMSNLLNGIDNMSTYGMTALYDALWTGVTNAGRRTGANCVIGFTDGADNESTHTYEEVISLANSLEIPIYLIGTSGADYTVLNYICESTGGRCWDINSIQDMNDILSEIYKVQKNMYCIEYISDSSVDAYATRTVSAALIDNNRQVGGVSEGVTFTPAKRAEQKKHSTRYELVKKDISWTDANDACLAQGGHLATITSQEEMDKITAAAEKAGIKFLWIGGYTSVRDNTVYGHWLTGEPFDFTAWHPGEPSRNDKLDGEPEFYLMLWSVSEDGKWTWNDQRNDVLNIGLDYFTGNMGYVCEYE